MKHLPTIIIACFLLFNVTFAQTSPQDKNTEIVNAAKASISHINPSDLAKKIESDAEYYLVDIRTKAEYDAGHLSGAVWVPRGKLEWGIGTVTENVDAEVILYCRSGGRSSLAVQSLEALGYKNVKDLDGGFKAWVNAKLSFYNMHGENTIVNYGKTDPKIK